MTREKKELLKRLDLIGEWESMDLELDGSGELGHRIHDHYEDLRRPIYERLNVLMHGRVNDFFMACVI